LFHRLERPGFLALGLCLYGNAAYVNCKYFVAPYKNVSGGSKDDFNIYHSQLRINIECAFGQLVPRWGLLRRALPANYGIRKSTSLVIALCRLHNYCIDQRLSEVPTALAADTLEIVSNGGIPLIRTSENESRPEQLLDVGAHNDDTSAFCHRQFAKHGMGKNDEVPREYLHAKIVQGGYQRPPPKRWRSSKSSSKSSSGS
jgi:DDE superfamily endonuclease